MEETGLPLWATLLLGLGGGGALVSALQSAWKWWTGRGAAERVRNREITLDIRGAEADADAERAMRIRFQEHAAHVRMIALEHGVPAERIPAAPEFPKKETP